MIFCFILTVYIYFKKLFETDSSSTWFSWTTNGIQAYSWAKKLYNEDKEESSEKESKSNYDMLEKSYELYSLFTTELDQIKYLKKIIDHLEEFSKSL